MGPLSFCVGRESLLLCPNVCHQICKCRVMQIIIVKLNFLQQNALTAILYVFLIRTDEHDSSG